MVGLTPGVLEHRNGSHRVAWAAGAAALAAALLGGPELRLLSAGACAGFGFGALLRRLDSRRVRDDRPLSDAARSLARAADPNEVLKRTAELLRRHLGVRSVEWVRLADVDSEALSPLQESGLSLWLDRAGEPQRVYSGKRMAGATAGLQARAVAFLEPTVGPAAIAALGPRWDGRGYSRRELRLLDSLALIATTALGNAATTAEVQTRVADKTQILERALADRAHVLETTRRILESERPESILACVERFVAPSARSVAWCATEPKAEAHRLVAAVAPDGSRPGVLVADGVDPARVAELRPQLETLRLFASLAIVRQRLLGELREEVLRQAREIAEIRTRKLHGDFVREVAHELRKPTEEIRLRAEQLRARTPPGERAEVERIRASCLDLGRRLGLLLYHSELRLDRRRVDLVGILDDALTRTRTVEPGRHYDVEHQWPRLPVVGDPSRLLCVAENLLDNACKATASRGRVRIRSGLAPDQRGAQAGTWAYFCVEDDGVGIPAARLDEIFEPGVAFGAGGFGLGLSLCREVVRGHGGTIDVESGAGGTRFRVCMPQVPRHAPAPA